MIDVIARYDNIMPFIHLPVQSGDDEILKIMGRRYTREQYLTLFHKIKERSKKIVLFQPILLLDFQMKQMSSLNIH